MSRISLAFLLLAFALSALGALACSSSPDGGKASGSGGAGGTAAGGAGGVGAGGAGQGGAGGAGQGGAGGVGAGGAGQGGAGGAGSGGAGPGGAGGEARVPWADPCTPPYPVNKCGIYVDPITNWTCEEYYVEPGIGAEECRALAEYGGFGLGPCPPDMYDRADVLGFCVHLVNGLEESATYRYDLPATEPTHQDDCTRSGGRWCSL